MAQATKSALIEFSYNRTMEWLKGQGEQQKHVLISLAQKRRKGLFEKRKQEATTLLKQKINKRIAAIKQAQLNQQKVDAIIDTLKSEKVIISLDELKERVGYIKGLSIPTSLQDAEIKSLVKKQIQMRTHIHHQSVSIFFSHHGNAKSIQELLQELSYIITSNPIRAMKKTVCDHQSLSIIFDKPSLLVGAKFKHRFNVAGTDEWFNGSVDNYRKNQFTFSYVGTDELSHFSLNEIKEDFFNGDFWIL